MLVHQGLASTVKEAQSLLMAGRITVEGERIEKAGALVPIKANIHLSQPPPYVGRGGIKLEHALRYFRLDVTRSIALDVGASTGGFTDCLLKSNSKRVYSLDIGYGQLDQKIRDHPKVVVLERTNARTPFKLEEPIDIATVDVSFISLTKVLLNISSHMLPGKPIVALVKPQFEAKRSEVGKGGVIRDPEIHAKVLARLIAWVVNHNLRLRNLTPSPLLGDAGNREFFLLLHTPST